MDFMISYGYVNIHFKNVKNNLWLNHRIINMLGLFSQFYPTYFGRLKGTPHSLALSRRHPPLFCNRIVFMQRLTLRLYQLQPVELQRLADDFEFLLASAGKQQQQQSQARPPPYRPDCARGSASSAVTGVEEFLGAACAPAASRSACRRWCPIRSWWSSTIPARRPFCGVPLTPPLCSFASRLCSSTRALLGQLEVRHQLRRRRTCSQPIFSISPKLQVVPEERLQKRSFLRRLKSLPNLTQEDEELDDRTSLRRRCQTPSRGRTTWTHLPPVPAHPATVPNASSWSTVMT